MLSTNWGIHCRVSVGDDAIYHASSDGVEGMSPVPFGERDFAGQGLVLVRSPVFINPVSASWLGQGGVGTAVKSGSSDASIADGFLGWALRREADGTYLQSARMSQNIHEWQHFSFDVESSFGSGSYTFDIIDNFSGASWAHIETQDFTVVAQHLNITMDINPVIWPGSSLR